METKRALEERLGATRAVAIRVDSHPPAYTAQEAAAIDVPTGPGQAGRVRGHTQTQGPWLLARSAPPAKGARLARLLAGPSHLPVNGQIGFR